MSADPSQLQLPRELMRLDESIITRPKTLLRAFVIAADLGGLDDKQAAAASGMDPSTWSQFKGGERGIKPAMLNAYLDQCANELPLAHWAYTRGYHLVRRESELERLLRLERARGDEMAKENALLKGILQGKAA